MNVRPLRLLPWLVATGVAMSVSLLLPSDRTEPREGAVLDTLVADYLEDAEPARPIAEVRAELVHAASGASVRLTVSAVGVRVDPVAGLEGVQGSNLRTARELHRLLRDDGLRVVVRGVGGSEHEGRVVVTRRGALPTRRVRADGTLDLEARTAAEWPIEVAFEAAVPEERRCRVYVMADGVPRLRVEVETKGGTGRILSLDSLGENLMPRSAP